jgi:nucleotide-binding universal stress UspA family protein
VVIAPRGWVERAERRFRRIGVGYDGSDESKLALQRACSLARDLRAELELIAVAPYLDPHLGASDLGPEDSWVELLKKGAESVGPELKVKRALRQGRPATALADESGALDLLVVGSRRGERVKRAVLGSVSSEVARTSACPVLVVSGQVEARDAEAIRVVAGRR